MTFSKENKPLSFDDKKRREKKGEKKNHVFIIAINLQLQFYLEGSRQTNSRFHQTRSRSKPLTAGSGSSASVNKTSWPPLKNGTEKILHSCSTSTRKAFVKTAGLTELNIKLSINLGSLRKICSDWLKGGGWGSSLARMWTIFLEYRGAVVDCILWISVTCVHTALGKVQS